MNKKEFDTNALGITYQMTLDSFLKDSHHAALCKEPNYEVALIKLKEMKQYRSWARKKQIALDALDICKDCIEAYLALGLYTEDVFETLKIYKEGMELATMNLGNDYFHQAISDFYELDQAQVFFHMKFAYACALFEIGLMRKALAQFQEILALNPSDVLNVRYYVYVLYLYFEDFSKFKELYERYPRQDTMTLYANFLYYYKRQYLMEAKALLQPMQEYNSTLYEILSNEKMNTYLITKNFKEGSEEEAAYCHAILKKAVDTLAFLPSFLGQYKKKS